MTSKKINEAHAGIVLIGIIMLASSICVEVEYINAKQKIYRKAEKKRARSAKRREHK